MVLYTSYVIQYLFKGGTILSEAESENHSQRDR